MSKSGPANQNVAPGTTAESQSSVANIEWSLLKLNVNEHTEKKQNLTYLSWAWAWQEALKADPKASFKVHTFTTDQCGASPVMDINGTAMVWVDVTLCGTTRTGFLPVMDHRNKPVPEPDAFQVNTALMRCMTKTLALFGLICSLLVSRSTWVSAAVAACAAVAAYALPFKLNIVVCACS
mgnify:CR=1 FL=1